MSLDNFQITKTIDDTMYNTIYRAKCLNEIKDVVLKIAKYDGENETSILKIMDHPNIIKLHDSFKLDGKSVSVIEYAQGGDLYSHIDSCKNIDIDSYFSQLLVGLQYMHSRGISHMDIKPENIVIDGMGMIKFIDFGFSFNTGETKLFSSKPSGTFQYQAPELINITKTKQPSLINLFSCDIWSLGIVLFIMIVKHFPWRIADPNMSYQYRLYENGDLSLNYWQEIPQKYIKIIKIMLHVDPTQRFEIYKHLHVFNSL